MLIALSATRLARMVLESFHPSAARLSVWQPPHSVDRALDATDQFEENAVTLRQTLAQQA